MAVIGWISAAAVVVLAFLAGWYFNGNLKNEDVYRLPTKLFKPKKVLPKKTKLNQQMLNKIEIQN